MTIWSFMLEDLLQFSVFIKAHSSFLVPSVVGYSTKFRQATFSNLMSRVVAHAHRVVLMVLWMHEVVQSC